MQKLAEFNFACVSFNFSHNGVSSINPLEFDRLDLFAENTHSKELEDLQNVISYFYNHSEKYNLDKNRIGLIGHSRGGAAVILQSSGDNRIKALLTLASVSDVNRYTAEQVNRWRQAGYIEIPNTRTNQMMRMNVSFLDDIESNRDKLNILKAVAGLKIPLMIIHGKEDLAVKYTEAEKIFSASDKSITELHLIDNTGHTFGIEHPFKGTTPAFEEVIELSAKFFRKHLP
ncbi:MAG: prolyl oligopeptidase family serine peptidase [Ignavibacteria bacterium]|nr:prolyl oligopeptidase family serine peptidase [Ignavibacteria bacterium]